GNPRETTLEFRAPAEVRPGLVAFQRDVPDHLARIRRVRLDQILRPARAEVPVREHAVDPGGHRGRVALYTGCADGRGVARSDDSAAQISRRAVRNAGHADAPARMASEDPRAR